MEKEFESQLVIIDSNEDIGHFDADICQNILPTSNELPLEPGNEVLINQIQIQIEKSKTNFFTVEVVKQESKPTPSKSKYLKRASKIGNSIIMQGYLQKKYESNILFKWNTRYAVLSSQKLYLFENNSKKKVMGCFNFKILPAQIREKSEDTIIRISFNGQCEELILRAPNNGMKGRWYKLLESVISSHSKENKLYIKTGLKSIYEDSDTITQQDLSRVAQTGDILLFHTDHTAGKLQRIFTQSEYDHVAMIVKLNGQLMVFEANQGDGVELYVWKKFIKYFNLYKKVTFRKLKCWRKKQLHHSLLSFAKKNLGRRFDIGAYKLLLKQESNFDWNEEKERGYFCSQLVAKAFKSVGLIEPLKACSRYWPVDFSLKGKIKLIGATLGHEQAILLNKHVKNN